MKKRVAYINYFALPANWDILKATKGENDWPGIRQKIAMLTGMFAIVKMDKKKGGQHRSSFHFKNFDYEYPNKKIAYCLYFVGLAAISPNLFRQQ